MCVTAVCRHVVCQFVCHFVCRNFVLLNLVIWFFEFLGIAQELQGRRRV